MNLPEGPSGFLAIDKPSGVTSFDVIRELRRIIRIKKLGHSGVLDKPATGLLVVGANKATRLFGLFSDFEKEYSADIWLGISTTTDDLTGELIEVRPGPAPPREAVESALKYYTGTILQVPPAFSLVKKGGRELYRYALAGEEVQVEPKRVTIIECQLVSYEQGLSPLEHIPPESRLLPAAAGLPLLARAQVRLTCTGGVYVRSLARDTGADLGLGGALGFLMRTRIGPFRLPEARSLGEVANALAAGQIPAEMMLPLASVAAEDARMNLDGSQLALVRNGQSIRRFKHHLPPAAAKRGDLVFGLNSDHELAAILRVQGIDQHGLVELRPSMVLG